MFDVDGYLQQAVGLHQRGMLREADQIYQEILQEHPDHPDALHLRGFLLYQVGQALNAIQLIGRAIALSPNRAEYHNNLGLVLTSVGRFDDAIATYRRAIELNPKLAGAYTNLGSAYMAKGQFDEAIALYRQALELDPNRSEMLVNLGNALRDTRQFDEAIETYQQAIRSNANDAEAIFNLAWTILLLGDLEQGWPLWESRWAIRRLGSIRRDFGRPMWDGSPLNGKTIYLHCERRFSDAIQFARYVPLVAARGGRVVLECPPVIAELFRSLRGVARVVPSGSSLPTDIDVHCPLQSLPMVMKATPQTIPADVPYLWPEVRHSQAWRIIISGDPGRHVGLVWAGGRVNAGDRNRSMRLSDLSPLSKVAGVTFYSLQVGEAAREAPPAGLNLMDYSADLRDFTQTAALIEQLDLVISVDTSVAHLAGALGKPVWTMLCLIPDWRWMLDRDDSPWYPTMRLFRQPRFGDWTSVAENVATALDKWARAPLADASQ